MGAFGVRTVSVFLFYDLRSYSIQVLEEFCLLGYNMCSSVKVDTFRMNIVSIIRVGE
jgi:hypothetical protein